MFAELILFVIFRLSVPSKQDLLANEHDNQPLVAIVSDDR